MYSHRSQEQLILPSSSVNGISGRYDPHGLNDSLRVAQLMATSSLISGGVVQRVSDDESEEASQAEELAQEAQSAAASAPQAQLEQPEDLAHGLPRAADILFNSRDVGSEPWQSSIYLPQGRIRLVHPSGPTVSLNEHGMQRYTFNELPEGHERYEEGETKHYEKSDLPEGWTPSQGSTPALKLARAGDSGKLYELSNDGRHRHPSRGRPIADEGMDDTTLRQLHDIASEADVALTDLRATVKAGDKAKRRLKRGGVSDHRRAELDSEVKEGAKAKRKLNVEVQPFNERIRQVYLDRQQSVEMDEGGLAEEVEPGTMGVQPAVEVADTSEPQGEDQAQPAVDDRAEEPQRKRPKPTFKEEDE